jgi:hypothetical protein
LYQGFLFYAAQLYNNNNADIALQKIVSSGRGPEGLIDRVVLVQKKKKTSPALPAYMCIRLEL